jgi:hypothetical protein
VSSYVYNPFVEHELVGAVTAAAGRTAEAITAEAREISRQALVEVLVLLGYPEAWANELEERSAAAGKVWRFERRDDV